MRRHRGRSWVVALSGVLFFFCTMVTSAWAIPALQLYIEGSTYDPATDTWVITTAGSFNLWVLGDVGHYGSIIGVKLSSAFFTSELPGSITLTSTTTSLVTDPFPPVAPLPTINFPSSDGAIPVLGNGSSLPTHGIYGPGTSFFEWDLGNFTLTDSPIGDVINTFPSPCTIGSIACPDVGQINVYTVTTSGLTQVHFDAYNHIFIGNNHAKYTFAPFSHDATGVVPEPSSLLLLGSGLAGLGLWGRRRRGA